MDLLFLLFVAGVGAVLRMQAQRRRIALLGSYLANYQIEKHMETLTQGYLRALGEDSPERREQIWQLLRPTEQALDSQFSRFAAEFARADADATRVSRLPLPFVARLLPALTFDARQAMAVHAQGIHEAVSVGEEADRRDRAYAITAELLLMQHTCHWFCKSRAVASARLLARQQTSHDQVLAGVRPATRAAYLALLGGA